MQHARPTLFKALRLLCVAASISTLSPAHADEYADVTQLLRAGKLTEAAIKADLYLAGKPRDPQMRFLKGVVQRDAGKTADAISTFTKLTEDYPELPEPYNNLAVLYAGQGQYDKARAALEMAIRTNPSYSTAHENLGDVYAKLASQAYNKALQLDNGNSATVNPKLALIREVFTPNLKAPHGVAPTPAPTSPAAPAPAPAKPAPAAPAPTAAPVPTATAPTTARTPSPAAAPTPAPAPAAVPVPGGSSAVAKAGASAPAVVSKPAPSDDGAKAAEQAVRAWASSWAAKDVPAYLAAYAKDFDPPGKQSRAAWEEERKRKIKGKSSIAVKLEHLNVTVNGNKAVARFRQDYRADSLAVSSRKTLDLVKSGDKWLIQRESTGG